MPDDDREDTATGASPTAAPHPAMDEELPTSITTSPAAAIERALADGDEAASEDGPTGIAKAPAKPAEEDDDHSPADDDGPTSISRVALDDVDADWEKPSGPVAAGAPPEPDPQEDGPTGVTKVDLPPPDEVPTGRTARPAGIVVPGAPKPAKEKNALEQDPEEDSVVTLQKPVPDAAPATAPAPTKSVPRLAVPSPPPRKEAPKDNDIYDVDDDKTERRDLPTDEINRAIARAKLEPVAISELPDESPTARRADLAITPKTGVRSAAQQADAEEEESSELATETDLGPVVRRTLQESAVRPPFGSESDNAITEPAIEKDSRIPKVALPKNTLALSSSPKGTQLGMGPPPPRPPEQSLGTDSYTFQGGAGELQAVIPVTTSGPKAQAERPSPSNPTASTVPPPPSSLLMSAAGAPSTQNMAIQQLPSYSQPVAAPSHSQMPAQSPASMALIPTAPSAFPASGHMPMSGAFPPPLGSAPNGLGLPNSSPRAPIEEPRWIVLVLGVLAVCILIPTVLYLVLHSRNDEAAPEETPVRGVVTIQTAQPRDYPKAERRR